MAANRAMTAAQRELLERMAADVLETTLYTGRDLQTAAALHRRGYVLMVTENTDPGSGAFLSSQWVITHEGRDALLPKAVGRPARWLDAAERAAARRGETENMYFWARQAAMVIGGARGLRNHADTAAALEQMVNDWNQRGKVTE